MRTQLTRANLEAVSSSFFSGNGDWIIFLDCSGTQLSLNLAASISEIAPLASLAPRLLPHFWFWWFKFLIQVLIQGQIHERAKRASIEDESGSELTNGDMFHVRVALLALRPKARISGYVPRPETALLLRKKLFQERGGSAISSFIISVNTPTHFRQATDVCNASQVVSETLPASCSIYPQLRSRFVLPCSG
jgi:hypothetical protein